MIERKQSELIVDGEYVRTYALRDFPATITTDWWSHLTDSDCRSTSPWTFGHAT